MPRTLEITIGESRHDARLSRHAVCSLREGDRELKQFRIDFEFSGDVLPASPGVADWVLPAVIFPAMREKAAIVLRANVSTGLLANLEEFQEVWHRWRPELYSVVPIAVEGEVENSTGQQRGSAVSMFSGGVDGTFTVLRHTRGQAGRRSKRIVALLMVHGFDIPLANSGAFSAAFQGAKGMAGELGVSLTAVRTNWRDATVHHWEDEFGAGLIACLHHFSEIAEAGLIGGDEDYGHLVLPWGSNPVSNPMLSSDRFKILTDGSGFTRTEKTGLIAQFPAVRDRLRVCWEGPLTGRNCGRCEKCVRTQLNFLAQGQTAGSAFDKPLTWRHVFALRARNEIQLAYLDEILEVVRRNSVSGPWKIALQVAVIKSRALLHLRRLLKWTRSRVRGNWHGSARTV